MILFKQDPIKKVLMFFILSLMIIGGGSIPCLGEEEKAKGTVKGKVMGGIRGVRGADVYQYTESEGWKKMAISLGGRSLKRGRYRFKTDVGTYNFKAEWAGRTHIYKNVEVKADPAETIVNFHLPPDKDSEDKD